MDASSPAPPPRPPLARAHAALAWERAAVVWWPALGFLGAFAVAALLGAWERFGDPARAVALGIALAGVAWGVWRGLRAGPWPDRAAALRRIEADTGFAGRPYDALDDAPLQDGPAAQALWRAHQDAMAKAAEKASVRRPRAALAAADPTALRGALVVAAIAAAWLAGGAGGDRLREAFALRFLTPLGADAAVEAWIDPPAYTGRAPRFLQAGGAVDIEAPAGSQFVARVAGAARAPVLRATELGLREAFAASGPGAYEGRVTLTDDTRVEVRGAARAAWRVRVIPDQIPTAAFIDPPGAGERQELLVRAALADDHGIEAATLEIRLAEAADDVAPHVEPLDVPPGARSDEAAAAFDLTSHPWAGRPVVMTIVVADALGQEGRSRPAYLDLPEKLFVDPLARAVAEQRMRLIRDPSDYDEPGGAPPPPARPANAPYDASAERLATAPPVVREIKDALDLMRVEPSLFDQDPTVHLGLAYVARRLALGQARDEFADLPGTLWEIALRAEGGELASAERALREAERRLARALALRRDEAEIEALMDAYRQAVDRYMEALRAEALATGQTMDEMMAGQAMSSDSLAEMLRALDDLASTGANDDARRLLSALSEMLRNLEMRLAAGGGGQGQGEGEGQEGADQAMQDALRELGEMIARQRALMDQTMREATGAAEDERQEQARREADGAGRGLDQERDGAAPGPGEDGAQSAEDAGGQEPGAGGEADDQTGGAPGAQQGQGAGGGPQALAERQGGLAGDTEDLSGEVGGGGADDGGLADAGQAMRDAEEALSFGDAYSALRAQGDALEALRGAAEALARDLMEQQRQRAGMERQGEGQGTDPSGRPTGDGPGGIGDNVEVPDEMDRQRAREILDELRKRAGETDRPDAERDYIRRLLDRF